MSKICPGCRNTVQEDSKKFCPYCGEPLNPNVQMLKQMENIVKEYKTTEKTNTASSKTETTQMPDKGVPRKYDDDEYIAPIKKPENHSSTGYIIAGVIIIVCIAIYFLVIKK